MSHAEKDPIVPNVVHITYTLYYPQPIANKHSKQTVNKGIDVANRQHQNMWPAEWKPAIFSFAINLDCIEL